MILPIVAWMQVKNLGLVMRALWGLLLICTLSACGPVKGIAIDTLVSSMEDGSDALRAHFDWETSGYGAASGIMQLEALYQLRPENEGLALALAKSYMAYAYGWVMDDAEVAYMKGDDDLFRYHQRRAYLMYTRAKKIAMRTMRLRDEGFDAVLSKGPEALARYLREEYDDPEDDLPPVYWLMMSWSSSINNSDDGTEFTDMPFVKVLAQHVIAYSPGYEDAGALVFMGGLLGSYTKALGGEPEKAVDYFERALKATNRRNHIIQVNYAKLYAVTYQDRELYLKLLHEVVNADDQGNRYRLGNKVAQRRAQRYLQQVDDLFF